MERVGRFVPPEEMTKAKEDTKRRCTETIKIVSDHINRTRQQLSQHLKDRFNGFSVPLMPYICDYDVNDATDFITDSCKGFSAKERKSRVKEWVNCSIGRSWANSVFAIILESIQKDAKYVACTIEKDDIEIQNLLYRYLRAENFLGTCLASMSSGTKSGNRPLICDQSYKSKKSPMWKILSENINPQTLAQLPDDQMRRREFVLDRMHDESRGFLMAYTQAKTLKMMGYHRSTPTAPLVSSQSIIATGVPNGSVNNMQRLPPLPPFPSPNNTILLNRSQITMTELENKNKILQQSVIQWQQRCEDMLQNMQNMLQTQQLQQKILITRNLLTLSSVGVISPSLPQSHPHSSSSQQQPLPQPSTMGLPSIPIHKKASLQTVTNIISPQQRIITLPPLLEQNGSHHKSADLSPMHWEISPNNTSSTTTTTTTNSTTISTDSTSDALNQINTALDVATTNGISIKKEPLTELGAGGNSSWLVSARFRPDQPPPAKRRKIITIPNFKDHNC